MCDGKVTHKKVVFRAFIFSLSLPLILSFFAAEAPVHPSVTSRLRFNSCSVWPLLKTPKKNCNMSRTLEQIYTLSFKNIHSPPRSKTYMSSSLSCLLHESYCFSKSALWFTPPPQFMLNPSSSTVIRLSVFVFLNIFLYYSHFWQKDKGSDLNFHLVFLKISHQCCFVWQPVCTRHVFPVTVDQSKESNKLFSIYSLTIYSQYNYDIIFASVGEVPGLFMLFNASLIKKWNQTVPLKMKWIMDYENWHTLTSCQQTIAGPDLM